jgi:hypothetical protein
MVSGCCGNLSPFIPGSQGQLVVLGFGMGQTFSVLRTATPHPLSVPIQMCRRTSHYAVTCSGFSAWLAISDRVESPAWIAG